MGSRPRRPLLPTRVCVGPTRLEVGALGFAACVTTLAVSGCVTVKPHERQYLAQPEMNPATDALEETFYSHIESAREGGFGGHGASGGGCGCG